MNSISDNSSSILVTNTNVIVWEVDDGKTLTICHHFNPNPETCSNVVSVVAFQSDHENVPVENGILMQFDMIYSQTVLLVFVAMAVIAFVNVWKKSFRSNVSPLPTGYKRQRKNPKMIWKGAFLPQICVMEA